MKNLIIFSVIILLNQNLFSQKGERIGIIDMDYILSQMDEYKLANEQLDEKMSNWKDEIELRSKYIIKLKDSLELEKPLLTKELIEDRLSEIEFEQKSLENYTEKRFGVNGGLPILPILIDVLNLD